MIEEHNCFNEIIEKTNQDATFDRAFVMGQSDEDLQVSWVINLYKYTPKKNISKIVQHVVPNFCPFCGEDLRNG